MKAASTAFRHNTLAATIEMGIRRFLHQGVKCLGGISWVHCLDLQFDKKKAPLLFCYAQCNNGALLYELFCCIKSIKKTFDEQRVLPSFSCNVEAVLRNEEIYEADLWYKELSGDIE